MIAEKIYIIMIVSHSHKSDMTGLARNTVTKRQVHIRTP